MSSLRTNSTRRPVMPKPEQAKRFEDAAREAGCDETGETFEHAFGNIVPPKLPEPKKPESKKPSH